MEMQVLEAIQQIHNPFLDIVMPAITTLGNSGMIWVVIAVLLLWSRKYRKNGFLMLLSLLCCLLLGNVFLKNFVARPRPSWIRPDIALLIPNPADYSFPSGHSMASFAGASALWLTNRKWGTAAYVLAGLIAFSRLYLFVHYPSDVLFGIVTGVLIPIVVFAAADKISGSRWKGKPL